MFVSIILLALSAAHLSHYLQKKFGFTPVRAAASTILLAHILPLETYFIAACFGGALVGMADPLEFPLKKITIASSIYAIIFFQLIHLAKGLGGALGTSAFLACLITHYIFILFNFWKSKRMASGRE